MKFVKKIFCTLPLWFVSITGFASNPQGSDTKVWSADYQIVTGQVVTGEVTKNRYLMMGGSITRKVYGSWFLGVSGLANLLASKGGQINSDANINPIVQVSLLAGYGNQLYHSLSGSC